MLLRFSAKMDKEAAEIDHAIEDALAAGARTKDLAGPGERALSTREMGQAIEDALHEVRDRRHSLPCRLARFTIHDSHAPCSTRCGTRTSCASSKTAARLLYIDRHLVHEVTSPQAFEGLRLSGRKVRRPDLTFATVDHNVPTSANRHLPIADPLARQQVETLREQRRRIRRAAVRLRQRPPGHRPRHRSRARTDAAGHDHRVRRQPHQHAWRVRRAGVRHRHERSRARAGHAVPGAAEAEGDARQLHGHVERRASPPRTSRWR